MHMSEENGVSKKYICIKEMLTDSGIDFKNIPKIEMMETCRNYDGKISKENYATTIRVINDLYES